MTMWGRVRAVIIVAITLSMCCCSGAFAFSSLGMQVGDCVWFDTNGNGYQEDGEYGLNGVTVTLTGTATNSSTVITKTTITSTSLYAVSAPFRTGWYNFGSLKAGHYTITVSNLPGGLQQTYDLDGIGTANSTTFDLTANRKDIDFGYCLPPLYSVGDRVWLDDGAGVSANARNGVQDPNEVGIANVEVRLLDAAGNVLATQSTDGDGNYLFTDLSAGIYSVVVTPPANMACTYDLDGNKDSQVSLGGSGSVVASLTETRLDVDFGYIPGSTGNYTTYTPGGWGAKPKGNNGAAMMYGYWGYVYSVSNPLIVGEGYTLTFMQPSHITGYLPGGGTGGRLTRSYAPPTGDTEAGNLGGQLTALHLSVDFSAAGFTKIGLGGGVIQEGTFVGWTVNQFLLYAERVMGGAALLPGTSITDLVVTATEINQCFDNGTSNTGYVSD